MISPECSLPYDPTRPLLCLKQKYSQTPLSLHVLCEISMTVCHPLSNPKIWPETFFQCHSIYRRWNHSILFFKNHKVLFTFKDNVLTWNLLFSFTISFVKLPANTVTKYCVIRKQHKLQYIWRFTYVIDIQNKKFRPRNRALWNSTFNLQKLRCTTSKLHILLSVI